MKLALLKIINPLLLLSLVVQIFTSIWFLFFNASDLIEDVHKYNGIVFIALSLFHVYLNWGWIYSVLLKRKK